MNKFHPVVIFGDSITAYGVIRSLSPYGIPLFMVSMTGELVAAKSRFINDSLVLMPDASDFINELNAWIEERIDNKIVLMVTEDRYLDVLSKGTSELLPGIITTFPDWRVVSSVRKKSRTLKIAKDSGIPIPKTYSLTSSSELTKLLNEGININYPILLRLEDSAPVKGKSMPRGVQCNTEYEILRNYEIYSRFDGKILLQELIPGGEKSLFCLKTILNRSSEPLAVFVDKKVRSSNQFGACTLTKSTWSHKVVEYGLRLLKVIGYSGYASVEFKFDHRDGQYKLIEVNGRISANNSNALKCGINLPYLLYQEALYGPLAPLTEIKRHYPKNILWWCFPWDIISIINNRVSFRPFEFLKGLLGCGYIVEPMNWRDPYPGLLSIAEVFSFYVKKIIRLPKKIYRLIIG